MTGPAQADSRGHRGLAAMPALGLAAYLFHLRVRQPGGEQEN